MSKNKNNEKYRPVSDWYVYNAVRRSTGHVGYNRPKYPTTRRLKCDKCKKTWKFSDKLNYERCPSCKEGRLS